MKGFSALLSVAGILLAFGLPSVYAAAAPTGQIRGSLFVDDNNNGVYDAGENVASVATLLKLVDGKWAPAEAAYTVENGQFVFQNLALGSYRVQLEFTGGIIRTTQTMELSADNLLILIDAGPVVRASNGDMAIPTSYLITDMLSGGESGERRSYVNISAIIGPEISPYKP